MPKCTLSGVRLIDLSQGIAGPYGTKLPAVEPGLFGAMRA